MTELQHSIAAGLRDAIGSRPVIVFAPKSADLSAWETLLRQADVPDLLLVALDDDSLVAAGEPIRPLSGVTSQLRLQHTIISELTGSTPPDRRVQRFDPRRRALVISPDPLDPPDTGDREVLGAKTGGARITEHKTIVDSLWDLSGVERADSLVCDLSPRLPSLIAALGHRAGVVISCQRRGASPSAGAEHLWWSTNGALPESFPALDTPGVRLRIMPLLYGLPCRVHGMVAGPDTIVFPPLELVSLPRPATGTFLWGGALPARTLRPDALLRLNSLATAIGAWLTGLGHQGAFAVDGIWTTQGYRPTELTPRLTSAFEGTDPMRRVQLHAANLLARAGHPLTFGAQIAALAQEALAERIDVYGATPTSLVTGRCALEWTPNGPRISRLPSVGGSSLSVTRSPRGRLLHAHVKPDGLPPDQPVGSVAPMLFALSDQIFGTRFDHLIPPFGLEPGHAASPAASHDARRSIRRT